MPFTTATVATPTQLYQRVVSPSPLVSLPPSARALASVAPSPDLDAYAYFTYRPLSNLPTPPLSSSFRASPTSSCSSSHATDSVLDPEYLGPAIHLVNLIPTSASLAAGSVAQVQWLLSRARLPLETVALAVCALDSVDPRLFSLSWRDAAIKTHPAWDPDRAGSPELVVLSALVVASKFHDDAWRPRQAWASWHPAQVAATERCLLHALGYRLLPLSRDAVLADAMRDMRRAARAHHRLPRSPATPLRHALPITPVVTPRSNDVASDKFDFAL